MHMISVVIPAYNEEHYIAACLQSLVEQNTERKFEVIVVDNNSTDRTVEVAKQFNDKLDLKIVHEPCKGRGAARHAGFKESRGDIIFSTDADAVLPAYWIDSFVNILEEDPSILAVSSALSIDDCGGVKNTIFNVFHPQLMKLYQITFAQILLIGCSFAIRKPAYEEVGGFDPLNKGLEDLDLSRRVAHVGRVAYDKNTCVTSSGRRFQDGLLKGMFQYVPVFFSSMVAKNKKKTLSDYR